MKKPVKVLLIVVQFLSFILLRIAYQPLNRILVNIFGCGCKEGFNCNDINNVVVFLLLGLAIFVSVYLRKIYENKKVAIACTITSIIINVLLFGPIWISLLWK